MKSTTRRVATMVVAAAIVTGCGGSDSPSSEPTDAPPAADDVADDASQDAASPADAPAPLDVDASDFIEDPEKAAGELAESLEATQNQVGGGSATLTVGDQQWAFGRVLCAFGPDQIGQEGAEFVLSAIKDGMQLYVSIDSYGHSISLNDIQDFENPSVDLGTLGDGFINLDGTSATATADFMDGLTGTTTSGTLEATCP